MALNDMEEKTVKKENPNPLANVASNLPDVSDAFIPTLKPIKKKRRKWPIIVISLVVVLALVFVLPRMLGGNKTALSSSAYTTQTVQRGDITVSLSGSGTLQPADSYTITSLISGDAITAPFEEGDNVQKNSVLYTVDSSDIAGNVEQAKNGVAQNQTSYDQALKQLDDLNLKSGGNGIVTQINFAAGDKLQAGQTVAVIRDTSTLVVKVMYQREIAKSLSIGQSAVIYSNSDYTHFDGVVTEISAVDSVLYNDVIARQVTVEVKNPGSLQSSQTADVVIGGMAGLEKGTLSYKYDGTVVAPVAGTLQKLNISEGAHVSKNQVIAVMQSDAVDQQVQKAKDALNDARLTLDTQTRKAGDYTITSPISGTIVEKDIKAGDTMKSGTVLCTVFDLSYLKLVLNVDELDIKKVQAGQEVTIKAGATPDVEYKGVVTKVNINGTTKNGVTTYPVTIKLEETQGLLPGMNVDATIVVEQQKDVITVPVSAVVRNNFVLVKSDAAEANSTEQTPPGAPAGYVYKEVKVGPSNDKAIVITEGLKEGDEIAVINNMPSSYDTNPFMEEPERPQRSGNGGGSGDADQTNSSQNSSNAGAETQSGGQS